ncbi:MAG: FHA domain-containing protein [Burkholderiales bacterium]|nr:FHA domain-containing protein [Burkholderiales bacterium]
MSQSLSEPVQALRISVLRWRGASLPSEPPPPSFEFDQRGGRLGRDDSCELLLPDPQRHVSRLQARIEFDGQGFVLVDLGSNPTRVDGQALGRGRRLPLVGGEQLAIGDYELEVVALTRGAQPSQPLQPQLLSQLSQSGQSGQSRHGLAAPVPVDDPFAVFAVATPLAQPAPVPLTNPFAAPASRPAGSASVLPIEPAASDVLGMGLALESASIDELFGLRAGRGASSAGMVLSWESCAPAAGAMPVSLAREPAEAAAPASQTQPQPQFQTPSPGAGAVPPPQRDAAADDPAAQLLAAFQRGLGQPPNLPAWLTPALMERVGQLLREVTQGTLGALHQRQSPDDGAR